MINKQILKLLIIAIISGLLCPADTSAQKMQTSTKAGEQRKAEKGLHDNRYFIYFLNSTVTNYGTESQKALFKEIIQRDIMSQFLYMKYLFFESFSQIRKSQKQMINLYKDILASEINSSKKQLDSFAPLVVSSKDNLARHYLYLGYRETTSTKNEMVMADSYRESLYSMRLYRYVKAIKRVKEAKKYALYAAIRAQQTPEEKIKQKPFTFEDIQNKLSSISTKDDIEKFKLISIDAFYKTADKTIYDYVWEKPNLSEIEEFKKILQKDE